MAMIHGHGYYKKVGPARFFYQMLTVCNRLQEIALETKHGSAEMGELHLHLGGRYPNEHRVDFIPGKTADALNINIIILTYDRTLFHRPLINSINSGTYSEVPHEGHIEIERKNFEASEANNPPIYDILPSFHK